MHFFKSFLLLSTLSTAAIAQDQPNTILVLDGSGSMWGQIDGIAKITIAQEVVSGLLEDFPADQGLGLTVYGHRERGNCTDIETIVAPAPGTVGDIVTAVNSIQPLGKTPMTDAVIAAANALRYTEDSATVILVSDGVETCNPDPCAAARLLEEAGIDFTAHVVGFDVSDPEALAQMQCIADETGGQFLTASNADELDLAMTAMVMEPDPIIVTGIFEARIGDNAGLLVEDPIIWDITSDAGAIAQGADGNPFTTELTEGTFTATAYRVIDEVAAETTFEVTGANDVVVTVIFPEVAQTATLIAPETAVAGSTITVEWTGPDNENDQIISANPGQTRTLTFVQTDAGNPAALRMPPTEGTYDIHYLVRNGSNDFLATTSIIVTPAMATLIAPDEGVIGERITVEWTGPDYQGDMILMAQDGGSSTISPVPTSRGTPAELKLPSEPGLYEIRYRMQQGNTILASKTIEVTAVGATITAPSEAVAGSTISVEWTGPDYNYDYLGIGKTDANGAAQWENFFYTRDGSPSDLLVPTKPGDYLITYFLGEDRVALASTAITVTDVSATITAPAEATAGTTIAVEWTGPDYENDYLGIGKTDAAGAAQWESFFYTLDGSPSDLLVPTEPGDYLIKYFLGQDRTKLVSIPITVTDVGATITAPSEALAGSTIAVEWTGPDYADDYVGVGKANASGAAQWENFFYTSDGSPSDLLIPTEPGDYMITYFLGQDRAVLATQTLTVSPVKASIAAPDTATGGETIQITWDGPDYSDDYIGIGLAGASGAAQWQNFRYTKDGAPLDLLMPIEAGDYEIVYFLGQDRDRLFTKPITITAVKAQLIAAETAAAGSELVIGWDGPDYAGDYLGVGKIGASGSGQWEAYAYTNNGNPSTVTLPEEPGDYVIQYFTGQDRIAIGSIALTIE